MLIKKHMEAFKAGLFCHHGQTLITATTNGRETRRVLRQNGLLIQYTTRPAEDGGNFWAISHRTKGLLPYIEDVNKLFAHMGHDIILRNDTPYVAAVANGRVHAHDAKSTVLIFEAQQGE